MKAILQTWIYNIIKYNNQGNYVQKGGEETASQKKRINKNEYQCGPLIKVQG